MAKPAHSSTTGAALPIDPTANVLQLVKEQGKRIEQAARLREKRQDDLRRLTTKWTRKLQKSEAKRLDANAITETTRVNALILAQQQAVLIAQKEAQQTAEALRLQVEATATAAAAAVTASRETLEKADQEIIKRVSSIEQNQWQGAGGAAQRVETTSTSRFASERLVQWVSVLVGIGVLAATVIYTVHAITGH